MASVPKGYLRHQVLKLLKEKPMSGADLIREIEEKTDGRWKPSPGSVYPLLSWLLDSGYTKEHPDQEAGVKRYELTDQGAKFLDEHEERSRKRHEEFMPFGPMKYDFKRLPEEAREVAKNFKKLQKTGLKLFNRLREDPSSEIISDVNALIEEINTKLELILEKKDA